MTQMLFRTDAYLRDAKAIVESITPEGGVILNQSLFYPTSGGQPGDSGWIRWDGKELPIATTVKAEGDAIALVPAEAAGLPPIGANAGTG
jgi:misacylated tRNA(Ala) deacylase